tara:strand:- start:344 stop:499 length:156 start_codon:yes stop_codon:yes gene_type:complete
MKKTELLHHICEFYLRNNSLAEKTNDGNTIVNKTTAQVFELKNKLFTKLNK